LIISYNFGRSDFGVAADNKCRLRLSEDFRRFYSGEVLQCKPIDASFSSFSLGLFGKITGYHVNSKEPANYSKHKRK
jgi:hypothetical protein